MTLDITDFQSNNSDRIDSSTSASNPQSNPLLNRLSPQQFEASVHFYEADQKLNSTDRNEVANDLEKVVMKTSFAGLSGGVIGFFIPTMINRAFSAKKAPLATIKPGRGIPPMTKFVYKPFLSFVFGLTQLIIVNTEYTKYQFSSKIKSYEQEYQSPSQLKQANIWKAMNPFQASMFYIYFRRTAEDSSFIIKDPRTFTNDSKHEVNYRPPHQSNHPGFLGNNDNASNNDSSNTSKSQWQQIRAANGFIPKPQPESKSINQQVDDNDQFDQIEPTKMVDDSSSSNGNTEGRKPSSAWDAIRQQNSK